MPASKKTLIFGVDNFQYLITQTSVEPGIRLGRVGAGDRYVASADEENRSAADESGSELVSQVAWVLLASCADLWKAGAGGSRRSAAAAAMLEFVDGGRQGCVVRHAEELTAPGPPSSLWMLSLLACAMPTSPGIKGPCTPGVSGCMPAGLLVREFPRRQQR